MVEKLSIKQNLIWNTVGALAYQGCLWLTTIVVVLLSTNYENSGILAFAMATGNIFNAIALFNVHTFQVSDTEDEFAQTEYVGFRIITALGALAICAVYSAFVTQSTEMTLAIAAFMLFKADEAFVNVLYGIDQKFGRMDYIGISQGVRGIAIIAGFSAGLAFTQSLFVAISIMFVACLAVTLIYDVPHAKRFGKISPYFNKDAMMGLFRRCLPLAITMVLYSLVTSITRQWFGIRFSEEELGIYAAVATPCVIIQVLAHYLYAPFLVPIAERWTERDTKGLVSLLGKTLAFLGVAIVVCLLGAVIAGPWLINTLFGPSIFDYSWLIVPAIFATSILALDMYAMDLLTVFRDVKTAVLIHAVALIVCLITMNPFFDLWYMNGINLVLIASFAASTIVGTVFIIRDIKAR